MKEDVAAARLALVCPRWRRRPEEALLLLLLRVGIIQDLSIGERETHFCDRRGLINNEGLSGCESRGWSAVELENVCSCPDSNSLDMIRCHVITTTPFPIPVGGAASPRISSCSFLKLKLTFSFHRFWEEAKKKKSFSKSPSSSVLLCHHEDDHSWMVGVPGTVDGRLHAVTFTFLRE